VAKRERRTNGRRIVVCALVGILIAWSAGVAPRLWQKGQGLLVAHADAAAAVSGLEGEMAAIGQTIRERQDRNGQAPTVGLVWPVPSLRRVEDGFGPRLHPILGRPVLHAGVDIPAQTGESVDAAGPGRVLRVERLPDYGQIVMIDHGGKMTTVYAHLSAVSVAEGQTVKTGDLIGQVGATGQVTGPHLHFEVRKDGTAVNPLDFVHPESL
jgi:murein DD-endopeptidase MepM/ murein hydrolase activator NlpD